jgi:hypothetical protein
MEGDEPPVGLSEEEAYEPTSLTRVLVAAGIILAILVGVVVVSQGAFLLMDEDAQSTWEFWGSTGLLGTLFIGSGLAVLFGAFLALVHNDNSLVLLFLGVLVLEVTMLIAVVKVTEGSLRGLLFLLMLLPFAMLMCFQNDGVPLMGV